jgi:hypothetical protein
VLRPIVSATLFPFDDCKSHIITLYPSFTSRSTVAFPNPEAAPVTKLTRALDMIEFNNNLKYK